MKSNFLRAKDISEILKISKALTYRLIAEGQIASVRFGRTVRVSEESLNEFIERNISSSEDQTLNVRSSAGAS